MKKATGLRRLINATRYSRLGLMAAWREQASFRQEIAALIILVPVAFWLGQNATQRALLLLSLLLIPLVELINSAIEAIVDRIGPEHHPLSGQAKDLGSAAVLVVLVAAAVVWALVAWERFGA
jgi:diacylglycerol kinase (ATP)